MIKWVTFFITIDQTNRSKSPYQEAVGTNIDTGRVKEGRQCLITHKDQNCFNNY